ncbi:MAG: oxidoreductase C-terminal domain-containing protein, partial [Acidimicrobiia bacterium]
DCDLAVVGVGIEPVADPVQGTDVQLDNGIVVDEFCRTNVDGIYAAGDVTNHYHPVFGRRVRVEHWHNALKQGEAAARSMLGSGRRYDQVHWFWSDQYELNIQYAGFHTEWDDLVVRGSMDDRDFAAFYIKDGLIDACVGFNRPRDVRRSMALIGARVPVDPDALRDEDVDLRDLAPGD